MKIVYILLFTAALNGCGGGLPEEKRQVLKEEMKSREIKKVHEEDIIAETFTLGQRLYKYHLSGHDSIINEMKARIYLIRKNDPPTNPMDWKLLDAYKFSTTNGAPLSDNVQRDGEEMIYTMPLVEEDVFMGIYVIRIPRKQVVLRL